MPPQMTSPTAPPPAKMTIRIYTVDRHGTVTQDRGTVVSLPHDYEPALDRCPCTSCRPDGAR